jgi:hypothetical protein
MRESSPSRITHALSATTVSGLTSPIESIGKTGHTAKIFPRSLFDQVARNPARSYSLSSAGHSSIVISSLAGQSSNYVSPQAGSLTAQDRTHDFRLPLA